MDADAELLDRLQAGDEAAFTALVRRYHPSLLRLAETLVGSRAVAEEAVQDTWIAVLRGVERFEGRSSLKTWLFHILMNRARTAGYREHRAGGSHAELDGDSVERFDAAGHWAAPVEQWADRVDDQLVARQLAAKVQKLLVELPPAQREVVLLHDVEGLPPQEVTMLAGITEGHRRVLLHRGRTHLRRLLAQEMGAS